MNPAPVLPVSSTERVELLPDPARPGSVLLIAKRLRGSRWYARIYRPDWSPHGEREREAIRQALMAPNPRFPSDAAQAG